jgi:hypothetical protein
MKRPGLKLSLGLGALSYLITVGLYFVASIWHPSAKTVFATCPACALTFTVDPSFASVALSLAPIDAMVYGVIGLVIGVAVETFRSSANERAVTLPARQADEQVYVILAVRMLRAAE